VFARPLPLRVPPGIRGSDPDDMAVTVVIRATTAQVQAGFAVAEAALVLLGEALGLGPLAPLVAQAARREAERRLAGTPSSSAGRRCGPGVPRP
jgi:hypothetical protein